MRQKTVKELKKEISLLKFKLISLGKLPMPITYEGGKITLRDYIKKFGI